MNTKYVTPRTNDQVGIQMYSTIYVQLGYMEPSRCASLLTTNFFLTLDPKGTNTPDIQSLYINNYKTKLGNNVTYHYHPN